MENTDRFFLGSAKAKSKASSETAWFLADGEHWVGPLTTSEVLEKLQSGEIGLAHYLWTAGQSAWKRICDLAEFATQLPTAPSRSVLGEVKNASDPKKRAAKSTSVRESPSRGSGRPLIPTLQRIWYLHYNDSQFGPFSSSEVSRFLEIGKIHGRVFAWMEGMANWEKLDQIDEFVEAVAQSKKSGLPKSGAKREQRTTTRRPLVAKVWMTDDRSVLLGICRDISVGGMQVLTDRVPGKPGDVLKLNISVSAGDKAPDSKLRPFVAEGQIVRVLEDGRGFSFRFKRLSDEAKRAIENFVR